jgi:hypothetical protein
MGIEFDENLIDIKDDLERIVREMKGNEVTHLSSE